MNPLTNVKNIQKLNEIELKSGTSLTASWHNQYKDSAWIFVGGLPYTLSEGDIITVFSQYGEIVNMNLIRDKGTGKSKGYCFICYEDQRSTILAVDNFNGIQLLKRTIRVDHVLNYKVPKMHEDDDDITKGLKNDGCAPKAPCSDDDEVEELEEIIPVKNELVNKATKKSSKKKKKKKKAKKHRRSESSSSDSDAQVRVKVEKVDPSYDFSGTGHKSKGMESHLHKKYIEDNLHVKVPIKNFKKNTSPLETDMVTHFKREAGQRRSDSESEDGSKSRERCNEYDHHNRKYLKESSGVKSTRPYRGDTSQADNQRNRSKNVIDKSRRQSCSRERVDKRVNDTFKSYRSGERSRSRERVDRRSDDNYKNYRSGEKSRYRERVDRRSDDTYKNYRLGERVKRNNDMRNGRGRDTSSSRERDQNRHRERSEKFYERKYEDKLRERRRS